VSLIEGITLAIALLGAVLGVINTWQTLDKDRVKLRVVPKHAVPVGAADPSLTFCIEITNLSSFAVTVDETGVFYTGTEQRSAYVRPILFDGQGWPRRLEPRTSVTVYGQPPTSLRGNPVKCAYARTACGVTQIGNSTALMQLSR
jgi:hypothetical protein